MRANDTPARIAHLLNVSEAELRTANPATIPANGQLYVGQVLCLPNDSVSLYVDGGASDEQTLRANEADWAQVRLRQRVLIDVDGVDTRTPLAGGNFRLDIYNPGKTKLLASAIAEPAVASGMA